MPSVLNKGVIEMRIITDKCLQRLLKEAYEMGLNIGSQVGYQTRKIDERHHGTILPGYDIDKDLKEILNRKEF